MADLDLLRDINNTYGHLAGDAVLHGIAEVFREQLRQYDVPARFGGEEFSILLPETSAEEALEIAERIRKEVSERAFDVETSSQPSGRPSPSASPPTRVSGNDANELIHQADLAVYRAKLQGRNRVLDATSEPLAVPSDRKPRLAAVPESGDHMSPLPPAVELIPPEERRHPRTHAVHGRASSRSRGALRCSWASCPFVGITAGVLGIIYGQSHGLDRSVRIVALVGVGQAPRAGGTDDGSISVSGRRLRSQAARSLRAGARRSQSSRS
jgi:diguanylate cyclase (GGDEF)-like protein